MTLRIDFVFVSEGSSDLGLISNLEKLCVKYGADEAVGTSPDFSRLPFSVGKTVTAQVEAALKLEPNADIVFVHRDADSDSLAERYGQVGREIDALTLSVEHVCVIPVQETEAWALVDEAEIRRVADNPKGKKPIVIPKVKNIEGTASPKEVLRKAIAEASEESGKRLQKINKDFPKKRRILLESIDIDGPINDLNSWRKMCEDINVVIDRIKGGVTKAGVRMNLPQFNGHF